MKLNKFRKIVKNEWIKSAILRENLKLDKYVIMPNHFDGIIILLDKVKYPEETNQRLVSPKMNINIHVIETRQ